MRELRQDVGYTLEPPKEDLDQIDEVKIEDVLMGLKGLKQEEVFSFLGKNNFTPAETEISSAGLGNYDQLASVDTSDMEQLQLSFNAHFEGVQGNHAHAAAINSCLPKFPRMERFKSKLESAGDQQRLTSMWPRYPAPPEYNLADYHVVENLREEEIVATNIAEELISTTNIGDEEDLKTAQLNNTYIIKSPVDEVVSDKPKPIKLLIKRVESEDEVSDSPASRVKSKRTRQPSAKRRMEEDALPSKQKRIKRPSMGKSNNKTQLPVSTKLKDEIVEELDFPFVNTVHQDDDFVYPLLDMSDEEDDVYSFSQRDDETWTPKNKMKINGTKNDRPARDRKRNNAVAKYLEAAAMKRPDDGFPSPVNSKCARKLTKRSSLANTGKRKNVATESESLFDELSSSKISPTPNSSYPIPSTSTTLSMSYDDACYSLSSFSEFSSSVEPTNSSSRKPAMKSKKNNGVKNVRRIIPPKTCKLVQEPPGAKSTTLTVQQNSVKKLMTSAVTVSNSPTCNMSAGDKKTSSAAYITKRGKPKKGMATAKQRLGKILKMHKMFF